MRKKERQDFIKATIEKEIVSSHLQLVEKLKQGGTDVCTSTISRDLKELNVQRVHTETGTRYQLTDPSLSRSPVTHAVKSVHRSRDFVVVKTLEGFANAVAIELDNSDTLGVLATIAGDDTILVIGKNDVSGETLFINITEYTHV